MDLDKVKYWTELSDYDFDTADWSKKKEEPAPYSHNLINLAQSCGLGQMLSDEQRAFVGEIMPLNIEARYPSYKQMIGDALSEDRCKELIHKTKELHQWVKTML